VDIAPNVLNRVIHNGVFVFGQPFVRLKRIGIEHRSNFNMQADRKRPVGTVLADQAA
jgi:hypothetical protein